MTILRDLKYEEKGSRLEGNNQLKECIKEVMSERLKTKSSKERAEGNDKAREMWTTRGTIKRARLQKWQLQAGDIKGECNTGEYVTVDVAKIINKLNAK